MFVEFDQINGSARVWIYQANRELSIGEQSYLKNELSMFTENWTAHGKDIKSSFSIAHNRFVVLAADESYNMATGCSIDSSVSVIKKASEELNVDFFDRTVIAFMNDDKVNTVKMKQIQQAVNDDLIQAETLIFNNLVKDVQEFRSAWLVSAGSSWLKRFLTAKVS